MADDKLTSKIRATIVDLIGKGVKDVEAYTKAGVSESTFYRWLAIGQAVAEDKEHAEMPKSKATREARRAFWEDVTRARAAIKERLITESIMVSAFGGEKTEQTVEIFTETRMNAYGKEYEYKRQVTRTTTAKTPPDWRASMEYLGRRYPEEWGSKTKVDVNIPPEVMKLLPDLLKALESANMSAADVFQTMIQKAAQVANHG